MATCEISPQDVTAIASAAIAVLALVATLWQAKLTREHNRKSTTPILTFHGDHTDGSIVFVRNDGVGPALLKKFEYYVDGVICESVDEFDSKLGVHEGITFQRTSVRLPATIGAEHSVTLLILKGEEAVINELISRVGLKIGYESIYGEIFETETYSA